MKPALKRNTDPPDDSQLASMQDDGLVTCLYRCEGCDRLVPWSNGAADDMPDHCDDCWAQAHGHERSVGD